MELDITLAALGLGCYGLASALALAALVNPNRQRVRRIRLWLAAGCVPLIALLLTRGLRAGEIPAFTRFEAITCYAVLLAIAYLHAIRRHEMRGIAAILVPYLTLIFALALPGLAASTGAGPKLQSVWLGVHILTAFAGYALFSLAAVLALAYLVQDYNLKHKHVGLVFQRLPSLEALDQLMYHEAGIAFTLFSLSIVLGIVNVRINGGGVEWLVDPKIAATIATWCVYALLMHLRGRASRHGRDIALITVAGMVFVLFAFLGVSLLPESLHDLVRMGGEVAQP